MSGRMSKWAIELGEHEIEFRGRNSIKGQILADFLAETPSKEEEGTKDEEAKKKNQNRKKHGNCSVMELQALIAPEQVNGLFEERQTVIKQYLEKAKELLANFPCHLIEHIKRDQNKKADALSKLALMTFFKLAKEVLVEVIQDKLISQKEVANVTQEKEDSWMIPIREYLQFGKLPYDPQKQESYE
ncbi:reverse transcriptase domain-containing protein [Tanacetum coccineum]